MCPVSGLNCGADALVLVDEDGAVLAHRHRRGRADLGADRVLAVIAGHRGVVREHIAGERVTVGLPTATGVFGDPAPGHPDRQIVFVLAGDLARLAPVAPALVEEKSQHR
jgi:hypothetical protein